MIKITSFFSVAFILALSSFCAWGQDFLTEQELYGLKLFKKCAGCHQVGDSAKQKSGPVLNDIIGKQAGVTEGFRYSKSMTSAGVNGLIWSEESLDSFLEAPKKIVPRTKMSFEGFPKETDRTAVISFIKRFSGPDSDSSGLAIPKSDPPLSEEILAISGDFDYGEYLSSNCVTCHKLDGSDSGIPAIIGWEEVGFATALHAYKNKFRSNTVMQQITGALSNEEIASLAIYFSRLK